jgi:tetratricopeptide (TPR) repeat protein
VKNRNWLNLAEYGLLAGAGVGSLATAASQQILYTLAPMSGLFVLNLMNRRRLAEFAQEKATASVVQLDQRITDEMAHMQKQVQALPSFLELASLRKAILNTQQDRLNGLEEHLTQLRQEMTKPEWRAMQQEVQRLRDSSTSVVASVEAVTAQLKRLETAAQADGDRTTALEQALAQSQMELSHLGTTLQTVSDSASHTRALQEQIDHLHRRLNQLPTPIDATALRQDVDALVKLMGDVPSRRELARLAMQLEQLSQDNMVLEQSVAPLKLATSILKKQLDTVTHRLQLAGADLPGADLAGVLPTDTLPGEDLRVAVSALEARLSQLSLTAASPDLQAEVQSLVITNLGPLQRQVAAIQQMAEALDQQQRHLRDVVTDVVQGVPQGVDAATLHLDTAALHNELRALAARLASAETQQAEWHDHMGAAIHDTVQAQVDTQLTELLPQLATMLPVADYELLFDLKTDRAAQPSIGCGHRAMLEQALHSTQARLIVVYPYPTPETLNSEMIAQFQAFLERDGCLDLGWGHLGELSNTQVPRSIHQRRAIDPVGKRYLYDILNQLTGLKQQYPDRFRFKVLGTDENFMVSDRAYAVLGSHALPTASVPFPEATLGLRTRNPQVIQGLIERFDTPTIGDQDALSYFNRALTRYDLGDRQGAIADYEEVLRIHPHDDVAYNNRGLVRYDLGDKRGAVTDFDLAIQCYGGSFVAYCNRGIVRAELGDRVGAVEDYTAALQLNPDYAPAYFYRGIACMKMQNKLGAIQDYTQVLRINPQDAMAHFYRGIACMKMGQRVEAIRDLRRAAQMFSDQGDAASYQQVVDTLQKLHQRLGEAE